jgi:DNA-binding LytR/AlgR family response regulator
MKNTCIIIDDEPHTLNDIRLLVEQTGIVTVLEVFTSATAAIRAIATLKPDVVISDMQMPEIMGAEMATIIQQTAPCKFIFITGHPDYALQSFDVDVIHYILKPVVYSKILSALLKFQRITGADHDPRKLAMPDSLQTIQIHQLHETDKTNLVLGDISHIQSWKKYAVIYLKSGEKLPVRESLKTLETKLPVDRFLKVQRSYIISLDGLTEKHLTARYLVLPYYQTAITINPAAREQLRKYCRQQKQAENMK